MAKVITFSRVFPKYHPKAGQPTYFVEKFWKSLDMPINQNIGLVGLKYENVHLNGKHHTIRAGERWKKGQYFSPRVWSGKPYNSKQIIIAPDTEIKNIWSVEIDVEGVFYINGKQIDVTFSICDGRTVADNDGLDSDDLLNWFPVGKPFKGQIICWNGSIKY